MIIYRSYHHFNAVRLLKNKTSKLDNNEPNDLVTVTDEWKEEEDSETEVEEGELNRDFSAMDTTISPHYATKRSMSCIYTCRVKDSVMKIPIAKTIIGPISIPPLPINDKVTNTELKEFLVLTLIGKAFLYKQIRIMVGTALAMYHQWLPANTIELAYQTYGSKWNLPCIPAEGLLCLDSGFDRNKGGKVSNVISGIFIIMS